MQILNLEFPAFPSISHGKCGCPSWYIANTSQLDRHVLAWEYIALHRGMARKGHHRTPQFRCEVFFEWMLSSMVDLMGFIADLMGFLDAVEIQHIQHIQQSQSQSHRFAQCQPTLLFHDCDIVR